MGEEHNGGGEGDTDGGPPSQKSDPPPPRLPSAQLGVRTHLAAPPSAPWGTLWRGGISMVTPTPKNPSPPSLAGGGSTHLGAPWVPPAVGTELKDTRGGCGADTERRRRRRRRMKAPGGPCGGEERGGGTAHTPPALKPGGKRGGGGGIAGRCLPQFPRLGLKSSEHCGDPKGGHGAAPQLPE